MGADFKIVVAILSVAVWAASWFVRKNNRRLGVVLSWVAVALAAAAVLMVWLA